VERDYKVIKKKDWTIWITLIVATVSLIVSGLSTYYQWGPRHDFRAYVSGLDFRRNTIALYLLMVNRGNQAEALSETVVRHKSDCPLARGDPIVVKPGEAAIDKVIVTLPPSGFSKSQVENGRVSLDLYVMIIDQRSKEGLVNTRLSDVFKIAVDKHGRPHSQRSSFTDTSQDLYAENYVQDAPATCNPASGA
jgi:hypothetical protein